MPSYTISGRVVAQDGSPVVAATISLFERFDLTTDRSVGSPATTDTDGRYTIEWTEAEAPASPWDLFVVADDGDETAQSSPLCDLEDSATIDLVLGEGAYVGQSEWTRLLAKLAPLLGGTGLESVPADRIEWLSKRADVSPVRLGQVIQAHRLADGRTVRAASCYAFMRAGLPADMPGMLRAGEAAWESALRGAWTRQVIDLPGDGSESAQTTEVAREVDAMRELLVDAALDANAGTNHRALFDTAGLSEADQRTFHEAWQTHTGDSASFWTGLEQTLDAGRAASFQFTIRAASLVANHVPTLAGLQAERVAGTFSTTVELAAWSSSDWDSFLVNRAVSLPADLPGSDATEQRQRYAKSLARAVEDRYPTAFVRHSLVRDAGASAAPASSEHVATFLGDNASFDLLRSTLSVHLAESSDPWPNIAPADQDAARANVARLQRVFRLAPRMERYATTKALLDQGVSAAADVVGYTREEFIGQFAAGLPGELHDPSSLAAKIWDNATKIHALTIGAASQLALANSQADFAPVTMAGSDAFAESTSGLAELSTILGELDYCACEHCRSVFSPAAYLADLLHFLKGRPAEATAPVDNALEALSARRPDIARILLDCANTHTPLPHIDLVNELLEATLSQAPSPWSPWHQTTWTQEELRAHPEHLDASAYDGAAVVATAVHPWSLPFSLPTVEARVYLKHLGVERHSLLERFEKVAPDEAATRARAGERLGLSALETEIVAGTYAGNASADGREYWGFSAGAATDSWVTDLSSDVGELLRLGGYTLDELRALLALDFINPDGAAKLQWAETCSLDDATLGSLDAALLDRLHRFTRLQRRCAIPARMLNVLLVDACGQLPGRRGALDPRGRRRAEGPAAPRLGRAGVLLVHGHRRAGLRRRPRALRPPRATQRRGGPRLLQLRGRRDAPRGRPDQLGRAPRGRAAGLTAERGGLSAPRRL
ncbi:hypothetical protein PPSIR1_16410 [Plesiocystis pacifica SIR-1]|uniref:Uncharacterized protein n=1 Tax=Plesiocystis pacifica SIR-1 TaxID=391625 RepID=A6G337_9BACT|nr:Tc toxin subunit A [Plesiocystis pacifica]EDM79662.1 hypothetical protein PPSIR1_16410 [Plesiocystis pacifica SIR-1]